MSHLSPPSGEPPFQHEHTSGAGADFSLAAEPQPYEPNGPGVTPRPPSPSARRSWGLPIATGLAGLAVGVGGTLGAQAALTSSAQTSILTNAIEDCGLEGTSGLRLADGDRTLTFDHQGEDQTSGANIFELYCLFDALDMPEYVSSHMGQTTSMDGRQTESWGDLEISWSYHPDRGMDGIIVVRDK